MENPSEELLFAVKPFNVEKLTEPFIFYQISEKQKDTEIIDELKEIFYLRSCVD